MELPSSFLNAFTLQPGSTTITDSGRQSSSAPRLRMASMRRSAWSRVIMATPLTLIDTSGAGYAVETAYGKRRLWAPCRERRIRRKSARRLAGALLSCRRRYLFASRLQRFEHALGRERQVGEALAGQPVER